MSIFKFLRGFIPVLVIVLVTIGFVANNGTGTLSSFGWREISMICPLGVLESLVASKTIFPRGLIALVAIVVFTVLMGRAFCAFICPVPIVRKLRTAFAKGVDPDDPEQAEKAKAERVSLKVASCEADTHPSKIDSRHIILGGTLISSAIFGFPVFCLVCPVGLTFATILLVMNLFGLGDTTIGVVFAPVLLLIEVVFFRKWCSKICPISALLSLIAKANCTFVPTIDDSKCLNTSKGIACNRCAQVCEYQVNPRHPEKGLSMSECSKCHVCVEACPGHAISMPFISMADVDKQLEAASKE